MALEHLGGAAARIEFGIGEVDGDEIDLELGVRAASCFSASPARGVDVGADHRRALRGRMP